MDGARELLSLRDLFEQETTEAPRKIVGVAKNKAIDLGSFGENRIEAGG